MKKIEMVDAYTQTTDRGESNDKEKDKEDKDKDKDKERKDPEAFQTPLIKEKPEELKKP
jgi:hypothetical protein